MADERDIGLEPSMGASAVRTDPERTGKAHGGTFRPDAHAVVIGIDRYADAKIRDLRYARADAGAVYTDEPFHSCEVHLLIRALLSKRVIPTAGRDLFEVRRFRQIPRVRSE